MQVGIESIGFYVPGYYLDLEDLGEARGVPYEKYRDGLGQVRMAVAPPDEDVVTMGTNAAIEALADTDPQRIDTVMFATETGVDQSKAAALHLHGLLGLPDTCKAFELKQACCSSTVGLLLADALVRAAPHKKILVVASDIARYDLRSPGEPTQGAGSVAFVVSAQPRILALDSEVGSYTEDVMDFWRPNYRHSACVDGKYSIRVYLKALRESWERYVKTSGRSFDDIDYCCYHLPFTKMAHKAHRLLSDTTDLADVSSEELLARMAPGLAYNPLIGNTYTASLYQTLLSLLANLPPHVGGPRIGFFSYGSGCMGAFFSGRILPGFATYVHADRHRRMLECRERISVAEYERLRRFTLPKDGQASRTPVHTRGEVRLAGINGHRRIYEQTGMEDEERRNDEQFACKSAN